MTSGDTDDNTYYDAAQRRIAAHLNHTHPDWHVTWGIHSRLYWAFPLFNAPPGTIISAATPEDLTAQMRHTEMIAQYGPPPCRQPPPTGAG